MPVVWWPVAVNFQFIFSSSADVRTTNKQTAERRSRSAATVACHLLAAAPAAVNAETLQHINSQCFSSDSPLGYSLHYSLINVSVRLQLSHVKKKCFHRAARRITGHLLWNCEHKELWDFTVWAQFTKPVHFIFTYIQHVSYLIFFFLYPSVVFIVRCRYCTCDCQS